PMPDTRPEEWRYTPITKFLDLTKLQGAVESAPAAELAALPESLRGLIEAAGGDTPRIVQVGGSVGQRQLSAELQAQGVIFTSLDQAVREHPELVEKHLGSVVTPEEGKFAAQNAAFWAGGTVLYIPANVRVDVPLRAFRWLADEGTSIFGRTLIVAEESAEVSIGQERGSDD